LLLVILIQVFANPLLAQLPHDSILPLPSRAAISDSLHSLADTSFKNAGKALQAQKQQLVESLRRQPQQLSALPAALKKKYATAPRIDSLHPFKGMWLQRPAFQVLGGYVGYTGNYRSNIDTPYAEKNILQHNITGQFNTQVMGMVPLQVNYWIRESNSHIFKDIADVQVSFSGGGFRNQLQSSMRSRMLALVPTLKDSLLEMAYGIKQRQLLNISDSLRTKFHPQKIMEAGEILKVPNITHDPHLPDSLNRKREDSTKGAALAFLDAYEHTKERYARVNHEIDSLKILVDSNRQKVNRYRQMVNGGWDNMRTSRQWNDQLQEYGMEHMPMPGLYRWLMGVRNFSLGRSPVNYSELTAKNISVNGINFEYNSWYYLAFTAGTVNYRFRDFVVDKLKKVPQYLVLARAGIGVLEKNYFIVSVWRGQKQLFGSGVNNTAIVSTGLSLEGKWALNRSTWLKAEVAQCAAPNIYSNPLEQHSKLDFNDKNSQAVALQVYSYIPQTGSTVEGFYKKAGANFQSFSSYQTSTALQSWYIKADQNLLGRRVRLSASLRSNDFSNPLIVQNYKSNTVFKSISASVRVPRWPMVTIGYQPMSQYTKAGDEIIENRFQTINATLYHGYTIKQLRLATTMMLSKFYNHQSDTGFIYYNATNSYIMQSFFFPAFTANAGASFTKNDGYLWQVLDGYVEPAMGKWGSVGAGIKIHNLNHAISKAGGYVNANVRIGKQDMLFLNYEHGYLPSVSGTLVRSEMGTIHYTRTFNFK
jgi:hypothetical protein